MLPTRAGLAHPSRILDCQSRTPADCLDNAIKLRIFRPSFTLGHKLETKGMPVLIDRDLCSFDKELLLYGQFATGPVASTAVSGGQARAVPCGPFHAVEVQARNLVSRRRMLNQRWGDQAILMVQHDGETLARQYNHQTWLRRGDIYLMDTRTTLELTVPEASHATCIAVPRSHVATLGSRPEAVFGSKISGEEGVSRLTWHFLNSLLGDRHAYDAHEAATITAMIQSMLSQSLKRPPSLAAALAEGCQLDRIKEWALRNIDDAGLDAARIARHFGLSRSALYRLFAQEGESPQSWLSARRLDEAHRMLSSPGMRNESVTEICFSVGFNDPSHFSRLFRKRFGICPREVRRSSVALTAVRKPLS